MTLPLNQTTSHINTNTVFSAEAESSFAEAELNFGKDFDKGWNSVTSDKAFESFNACMNAYVVRQTQKEELILSIKKASTSDQLKQLYEKRNSDLKLYSLLDIYIARQHELELQLKEQVLVLKGRFSTYMDSNGELLGDLELEERIQKRCPKNTYQMIKVTTLDSYQFPAGLKKAREIQLIRNEWGKIKIPILNGIEAFLSSTFQTDPIYREPLGHHLIMCGILASSLVVGDEAHGIRPDQSKQANFEKQIRAAYWSGKKIEIVFPVDLSESGACKIIDESTVISFSINAGKFLRSLFTND